MIVKNEEQWLGHCLDSIKDVVDEMIIVDTGSTDSTRDIARGYGARLFSYHWNNSFADARNFGLKQATGDWILWLDADEEIDRRERHRLRDVLGSGMKLASLQTINYYGESPPDPARSNRTAQFRLFRNHPSLRFCYAIHEQLQGNFEPGSDLHLPVYLHHYGYMNQAVKRKNKSQRNMQLLLSIREEDDYDPWFDYHLASEWYQLGDLHKAFDCVNLAILRFIERSRLPPSLVYRLKYTILIELGSYEGGWPGIEAAIRLYPDYADLHLYKGIILMHLGCPEEALEAFFVCLSIGDADSIHLASFGSGSFQAWYYIAQCLEMLDRTDEAIAALTKALEIFPSYEGANQMLEKLKQK